MNSVAALTERTPPSAGALEDGAGSRLGAEPVGASAIDPAAREGRLTLSFAQERLWFIDWLEPGSAVYNIPMRQAVADLRRWSVRCCCGPARAPCRTLGKRG